MSRSLFTDSNLLQDHESGVFNFGEPRIINPPSTEGTRSAFGNHPTSIRGNHPQGADFSENASVIKIVPYEDVTAVEPEQPESVTSEETEL
ncbi:unnamed protein product [Hymenolepis diminuta]|uniref:Uncharacterized protein n=1 Tax=Hymenolepis diminuta TaxID=6216 RepID=A0A0R3SHZ3_HYMDI|nr:unnamed protein product [Hymenolepis diminuta]VUZ41299.1 unnamed protein product [Hymenolepis diminuta]